MVTKLQVIGWEELPGRVLCAPEISLSVVDVVVVVLLVCPCVSLLCPSVHFLRERLSVVPGALDVGVQRLVGGTRLEVAR